MMLSIFLYLLTMYMFSLKACRFRSFAHVWIGVCLFVVSCKSLCILDRCPFFNASSKARCWVEWMCDVNFSQLGAQAQTGGPRWYPLVMSTPKPLCAATELCLWELGVQWLWPGRACWCCPWWSSVSRTSKLVLRCSRTDRVSGAVQKFSFIICSLSGLGSEVSEALLLSTANFILYPGCPL